MFKLRVSVLVFVYIIRSIFSFVSTKKDLSYQKFFMHNKDFVKEALSRFISRRDIFWSILLVNGICLASPLNYHTLEEAIGKKRCDKELKFLSPSRSKYLFFRFISILQIFYILYLIFSVLFPYYKFLANYLK